MFPAHQQIDTGDGEYNCKQDDSRRGRIGGIAAAVAVQHVVHIAHDGIHLGSIQIGPKQSNRVAVCLECADEAGDDQIEDHGRDHGNRNLSEDPKTAGAVHFRRIVVHLVHAGQSACEDQDLEGHYNPHGIETQHKHFCPVRAVNEVNGAAAEQVDQEIHHSVGVRRLLKQDHKYQAYGQGVCHIGQEVHGLEQIPQRLDGA